MIGCMPFIGIDGYCLNGSYAGVIFSAMFVDVNNEIFPMAFTTVEVENMNNLTLLHSTWIQWLDIQ